MSADKLKEMLLDMLHWYMEHDELVSIPPEEREEARLQIDEAVLIQESFIYSEVERIKREEGELTPEARDKLLKEILFPNIAAHIKFLRNRYGKKIFRNRLDYLTALSTEGRPVKFAIEGEGDQGWRLGCYGYNQATGKPRAPEQQQLDYGGFHSWTKQLIREIEEESRAWEKRRQEESGQKFEGVFDAALYNFKHQFDKNEITYLNLAGEFSSNIPGHDDTYSENSPAGDPEDHHLYISFEEFNFKDNEIEQIKAASIKEAYETFKQGYNTVFTTWLYRIFYNNIQDLYRNYKTQMKGGQILSSLDDYSEHKLSREVAQEAALHYTGQETWEQLSTYQKEWLILYYQVDPNRLEYKLMAEILEPEKSPFAREQREYRERVKLRAIFEPTIREQGIQPISAEHYKDEAPALVCSGYDEPDGDLSNSYCRYIPPCNNIKPCCKSQCIEYKPIIRHEFEQYSLRTWPQLSREHLRRRKVYQDSTQCEFLKGKWCHLPGFNLDCLCENVCSYRII